MPRHEPPRRRVGDLPRAGLGDQAASSIPAACGPVAAVTPLGRLGNTFRVEASSGRMVVKRLDRRRDPAAYRELFSVLTAQVPALCPALLGTSRPSAAGWYACFAYVPGKGEAHGAIQLPSLEDMLSLANRLRQVSAVPAWPVSSWWLERILREVPSVLADHAGARWLAMALSGWVPGGPPVLAHGDFNPGNVVVGHDGPVLVDWEEVGAAPDGFDAGWLLALARVSGGIPWTREALEPRLLSTGIPREHLRWFEALGILRLLYRARTAPMPDAVRPLVTAAVGLAVDGVAREVAEQQPWPTPLAS